jgi:hypothetical protein
VRYSVFRALYGHTNLNPESKEANILQEQQATEAITGGMYILYKDDEETEEEKYKQLAKKKKPSLREE